MCKSHFFSLIGASNGLQCINNVCTCLIYPFQICACIRLIYKLKIVKVSELTSFCTPATYEICMNEHHLVETALIKHHIKNQTLRRFNYIVVVDLFASTVEYQMSGKKINYGQWLRHQQTEDKKRIKSKLATMLDYLQ